jgi:hypothetical protein
VRFQNGGVEITACVINMVAWKSPRAFSKWFVGPAMDICEAVTGKEWCLPSGRTLTTGERVFSGIGFGVGKVVKVWKGISSAAISAEGKATAAAIDTPGSRFLTSTRCACSPHARRHFMSPRFGMSGLFAASAVFSMLPLGCGAAQDDYTLVAPSHGSQIADERPPNDIPGEAQKQMQACFAQHKGPWSHHRYAARYEAYSDKNGALDNVKLQATTLDDEPIESCVRGVIASLKVPESVLRTRRSGPVSGGEHLTREQRGSLGNNDSQNPLVWFFFRRVGVGRDRSDNPGIGRHDRRCRNDCHVNE